MAKQQSTKVKQLILDLESGNPVKISAALKLLQVNGTISVLTPLANLLLHPVDKKNKDEILEFFSTLNDSNAVDTMIELIKNEAGYNRYVIVNLNGLGNLALKCKERNAINTNFTSEIFPPNIGRNSSIAFSTCHP